MIASDNVRDPFYPYGDLDMMEVWREGVRILHLDYPFADWAPVVRAAPAKAMGIEIDGAPAGRPRGFRPDPRPRFHRALLAPACRPHRAARRRAFAAAARLRRNRRPGGSLVSRAYDIDAFRKLIGPIKCEDNPVLVKQKSRDFYWYSPVLKRELDAVTADIVVSPVERGRGRCRSRGGAQVQDPGHGAGRRDRQLRPGDAVDRRRPSEPDRHEQDSGHRDGAGRLRTRRADRRHRQGDRGLRPGTADVSRRPARPRRSRASSPADRAAIGSITWGGLRDFGNVLRLRVMTMEAEPRTLELTGQDLHKAVHAYGTNGVITEVEMPLTARYDWVEVIVGFDSFDAATGLRAGASRAGRNSEEARDRCGGARAARLLLAPSRHDTGRPERRAPDDRSPRAGRLRGVLPAS